AIAAPATPTNSAAPTTATEHRANTLRFSIYLLLRIQTDTTPAVLCVCEPLVREPACGNAAADVERERRT
ncbi:hypothetical protein, partial [Agromyces humi]|uniref:hypothetical protein n=1 Tax=Agromyces humi TaxID=1766800 RepID=UPI0019399BDF